MAGLPTALKAAIGMLVSINLLSGCAINMPVPIKDPAPSDVSYKKSDSPAPIALRFLDQQSAADKANVLSGRIPMRMLYQGQSFDAVPWLASQTVKELVARGVQATLAAGQGAGTEVRIKRFHIENHRVSGFSPFVTFTSLRADVLTDRGTQRVTSYIKRGKVPVWSFDEVIDPTYNDALGLLIKELAAKLNQQLSGRTISDEQVATLIARIKANEQGDDAYLDVYQLGFGNNPAAVPELVRLSSHTSEYIRLAAISAIGILKAQDRFDFLTRLYETKDGLWQDRAMALKAIGDFNDAKSRAFLIAEKRRLQGRKDTEARWNSDIIALYLDDEIIASTPVVPRANVNDPGAAAAQTSAGQQTPAPASPALPDSTATALTSGPTGRQIVGAEFITHVRSLGPVMAKAPSLTKLRLNFRANGLLSVVSLDGGGDATGVYTVKEAESSLCLVVHSLSASYQGSGPRWKMLQDCYRLFDLGSNSFVMRSVNEDYAIFYTKN